MANEFGTGWAAAGAEGYFNPEKLHYQGGDSWGASTWENLAMFDSNGNPLDSLRFYADAVPESAKDVQEQIVMIHCADSDGKPLGSDISVKLLPGETKTIDLPKIKGYVPKAGSYVLSVTGTETASAHVTVVYYIGSDTNQFTIKKAYNPLKVKAKTATVKVKKLRKKTQSLKVSKVISFTKNGKGKMRYKLVSAKNGSKSFKKYFKINKTTGKVTIKKNSKMKKGTYKVKVKVKAAGNANYKASAWKTVTFKIKVK
jgi:hypothetical protein